MGELRLTLPSPGSGLQIDCAHPALWVTQGRRPRLISLSEEGSVVRVPDPNATSGILHMVGRVKGGPPTVLGTSSLLLRDQPYRLESELARGQANKLRNMLVGWQREGFSVSEPTIRGWASVVCQAVKCATEESAPIDCLHQSIRLGDELAHAAARCLLQSRIQSGNRPQVFTVGDEVSDSCESDGILIPVRWNEILTDDGANWDEMDAKVSPSTKGRVIGPVIDFRKGRLPASVHPWRDDVGMMTTVLLDAIESVMGRFGEAVSEWFVLDAVESIADLDWPDDRKNALVSQLLSGARQMQPQGTLAVGIEDPWGWSAGRDRRSCWPVEFLDEIVRRGVKIDAIHIAVGAKVDACAGERSLLDVSKMLDRYVTLPVPLWISVADQNDLETEEAVAEIALSKKGVERVFLSQRLSLLTSRLRRVPVQGAVIGE